MKYYILKDYGNRDKYISIDEYFFTDKGDRVQRYPKGWLTDWKSDYENFNFFEADLYSDKEDKANWNNMFAAAQLKETIESKKIWGDILGCTGNLIINKKVRDIILPFCDPLSTKCIPIKLRKKNKLEFPSEYFLLDPLLILDTLNYQESKFTFFFDESQSDTENIVLDSIKLKDAPDVFRIKHEEYDIIISQNVEDALKKKAVSNYSLEELPQKARSNDINDEKYKLSTALISAIKHKEYDKAKSMIERGADLDFKDAEGITTRSLLEESEKKEELIVLFEQQQLK